MKLRDRLLLFSSAQLLVFGAVFAAAYTAFERSVVPMVEDLLSAKAERTVRMAAAELDVPLGAEDRALIARAVADIVADPDFSYVAVRDARRAAVFEAGAPPIRAFDGATVRAHRDDGTIASWAEVRLDQLSLGAVAIGYRTARVDAIQRWARRIALAVAAGWLVALAYSIAFARALVAPIRAMMVFSRKVAGGALDQRLTAAAHGELGELRDYLNQMTADLERREADRQAAARHTEAMQHELIAVSRMAGMAEIATGVLHNVGNVLNSLNVSVTMISDQVKGSRIGGLARSLALVDGYPGGLAAFLSTDKGKVLPSYLTTVSRQLGEEQTRILAELIAVNRNVDHIKTIVAMQQSYARPYGVHEPIDLGALIDDALQLGEPSFVRHGIEVVKDYGAAPPLRTDRHKVLQIVINLISNARHALKDRPEPPHQLIVRVRATPGAIAVIVEDTGVGIPAEHLDKIFQHGFTTKPGGHGFGLHASANAARELGGSLAAASDGPGRGARFTLALPIEPPAVAPAGSPGRSHALHN
jgi:signal transduction histidine kinase